MINLLIDDPNIRQYDIGQRLGLTPSWVSACMASKVFKERLLERQGEIVDPILQASLAERFEGMLLRLIEIINGKLNQENVPDRFALKAFELALRAAGYTDRAGKEAPLSGNQLHIHLESMAQNLVAVLRTKRAQVVDDVVLTVEKIPDARA